MLIKIEQVSDNPTQAKLSFDGRGSYAATLQEPFEEKEQAEVNWYFETFLTFPYINQERAAQAAASLRVYGTKLFEQLFHDRVAYSHYAKARANGLSQIHWEIVGEAAFQRYFWEALYDPELQQFISHQAIITRNAPNAIVTMLDVKARPSPTINLLLVVARPFGKRDVGYRTISRPLVEALRQAQLRVQVDWVRPGSYEALVKHLEETTRTHGAGYYHLVHFDLHGAVLSQAAWQKISAPSEPLNRYKLYGREPLGDFTGEKAMLFFEGEDRAEQSVEAITVARLLRDHHIPIAFLNACQAGQFGVDEPSLAIRLIQEGVQTVVAMRYSVFVPTAKLFMQTLYEAWLRHGQIGQAVQQARQALANDKQRSYTDKPIYLEDWLLPMVYQSGALPALTTVPFASVEAQTAFYQRHLTPITATTVFFGRDLDMLALERRLGAYPLLLVQGLGGLGKTTLLKHAAEWWKKTGWVRDLFYFGYDERAWTLAQIMHDLAQKLISPTELGMWLALPETIKASALSQMLRGQRHLIMVDNCESITGNFLAIQHTLNETEQAALREFWHSLADGQTLVLFGSRDDMAWLKLPPRAIYALGGLDAAATQAFAQHQLDQLGLGQKVRDYLPDEHFRRLLALLDGHPLALQVILSRLRDHTPTQLWEELQQGEFSQLDNQSGDRTQSILACIEYAYHDIDPQDQALLMCLAPFNGVIGVDVKLGEGTFLDNYNNYLHQQPTLTKLSFDRWTQLLQTAQQRGLLTPHENMPGYFKLQPIFPYFLRQQLDSLPLRDAINTAFHKYYDELSYSLISLLKSKEANEKILGQDLTHLEYENMAYALNLALEEQAEFYNIYNGLHEYLMLTQDHERGLNISQKVYNHVNTYPLAPRKGLLGLEFARVYDDIGLRQLRLKQYYEATQTYQTEIELFDELSEVELTTRQKGKAAVYHQLGRVAGEQRQWQQAEKYYQQSIQLNIELNDHYEQAKTYHQLGIMMGEQRQWVQAKQYYYQALQICVEFNDHYHQALVYHQLGRVAEEQRQWMEAEQYYQQALQIWVEFDDDYYQAGTYHQLGYVAQEQQQWMQAEEYYQRALHIYIRFNDRYEQTPTYHQLGTMAEAQGQFRQAVAYLLQTRVLCIEYQDKHNLDMTMRHLQRVVTAAGDEGLWDKVAGALGVSVGELKGKWATANGEYNE